MSKFPTILALESELAPVNTDKNILATTSQGIKKKWKRLARGDLLTKPVMEDQVMDLALVKRNSIDHTDSPVKQKKGKFEDSSNFLVDFTTEVAARQPCGHQ